MLLANLLPLAIQAYRGTSFHYEKRGEATIASYSEQLESDLASIEDEETKVWYEKKYRSLFTCWLSRRGNCMSTMITGGSNFNVSRNNNAYDREHNAYGVFFQWRERILNRQSRPTLPKGIDEELRNACEKMEQHQKRQDHMKAVNSVVKKKNAKELLLEMGIKEKYIETLLTPQYSYEKKGYQTYQLTNNLAKFKHYEGRVMELEAKVIARNKQQEVGAKSYDFTHGEYTGTVTLNYDDDRLQVVVNEGKPDAKTREYLSRTCALNWSPRNECWQRKITANAIYHIRQALKKDGIVQNLTAQ